MEIITSFSKTELEQLIVDSVQKCLNSRPIPQAPAMVDELDIDEVAKLTGYRKATIYHKIFTGAIPSSRRGKRLIFSRKEIIRWMQDTTIRKLTPEAIASLTLAESAKKKGL